jgi:hypothetical protein
MAQKASILAHLLSGKTISQAEARQVYGVERLASRIFELKQDGHTVVDEDRFDEMGKRYTRYRLVKRGNSGQRKGVV